MSAGAAGHASAARPAPGGDRAERGIWFCADDYGIAPGVNAAIRELIARERLNATSVMTLAPAFSPREAQALTTVACGRAAIGLHVTLTAPFTPAAAGFAPVRGGAFLPLGAALAAGLLRRYDEAALAAEISRQFLAFAEAFGAPPAFVDGHQHAQLFPQLRDAVLAATRRYAPHAWVRQCGGPAELRGGGAPSPKRLFLAVLSAPFRRKAARAGLRFNPAFAGVYAFRPKADFAALLPSFLRGLPDGAVVMCHPGFVDEDLQALDPLTTLREAEFACLAGDGFPAVLSRAGVRLLRPEQPFSAPT